jgi:outer membrane protein OmpA-like peptidoglycan-associated protein
LATAVNARLIGIDQNKLPEWERLIMKSFFSSFLISLIFLNLTGCVTPKDGKPTATISDEDANAGFRIKDTPRGAVLAFNDKLLFDTDKSELNAGSAPLLDRIGNLARERDIKNIEISGHTDNVGSAQYNKTLSDSRARAVKAALIGRGIREERIKAEGFGFAQPEATNDTAQGRALNRRAEILFVNVSKKTLGGEKMEKDFGNDVKKVFDSIGGFISNIFKPKEPQK